jgi:MFS family permease
MPNLHHLYSHIKKYGSNHQSLYLLCFIVFFFTIFDSIVQYVTPLILTERGFSNTEMGLIIGSSSVFGAIFDFIFCRFVKNVTFRRIFLFMLLICFVYPIILWGAKTVWIFLVAMALWGVYYDLYNYGVFDFVGRYTKKEEHSSSFGVTQVFRSMAQVVAPIIAGLTIVGLVTFQSISFGWIFLAIAALSFSMLLYDTKNKKPLFIAKKRAKIIDSSKKIALLGKIIKIIFPALVMTMALTVFEAFYWTLGPLYAEQLNLGQLSGFFVTAYSVPAVLLGWYVGAITNKLGKKRAAYITFLIGSVIMTGFIFVQNDAFLAIAITFIAACFLGLSLPAINGAYADYISETPELESEIEAAQDFFINAGYIVGPMIAGIMADTFDYHNSFAFLGMVGVIVALLLLKFSPKHIKIKVS